ncbi:MAG: hypothetical protein ACYTKD_10945 [Planctomycetota bacterium]|jgi:hypothetical protein
MRQREWLAAVLTVASLAPERASAAEPTVIVAEGERFAPEDDRGWRVMHQDRSHGSHAYGGMWVSFGGLIGAPAEGSGSVAKQTVTVPAAGRYRVWSKYQSPPYFSFLHRVEIHQRGRRVFAHTYGKIDAERMYSFSGHPFVMEPTAQVWFPWGVDHDAAEAPREPVTLTEGPAEIRLITVPNAEPGGDRYVDHVVLTTEQADTFIGKKRNGQAKSPFMYEALRATPIYMRFRNTSTAAARAYLFTHFGHFTWHCAPKAHDYSAGYVQPGEWSEWFNINRTVELFTDEGVRVSLSTGFEVKHRGGRRARRTPAPGVTDVPVQIAMRPGGRLHFDGTVPNGESLHIPLDFMWNTDAPGAKIRPSREIAAEVARLARTQWRKAARHKPEYIAFYGAFDRAPYPWVHDLKDALGYNTLLPERYETLEVDGYHQHLRNPKAIREFAAKLGADAKRFRVCSFGDEIHIGGIDFKDPKYTPLFRRWLEEKGLTKRDLGVDPAQAELNGNDRLTWYSRIFSAEQRFAHYRSMTAVAREAFGPQVLTGANYSWHHGMPYYGDNLQWIDAFKQNAMSMFWTEDYIFSVPEVPQIISFLFARIHCAVKYNGQPIHMYVMPHSPAQTAANFRRNLVFSIGSGARHIDNFWVAPQEAYSENYVSWRYVDMFREIHSGIHDTAAVEPWLEGAKRRKARVALVTGKATDINESHTRADEERDPFLKVCRLTGAGRGGVKQNICHRDQQALYLALRHAQVLVDLVTDDDIAEDGILRDYDVVYHSGEWADVRVVTELAQWVRDGGVLYACTGLGRFNRFGEEDSGLLDLLGLERAPIEKDLWHVRPLLELPLAEPIDLVWLDGTAIPAIAFRQKLAPRSAEVLGTWSDGTAAVTVRRLGKGRAYAVGTAPGLTYLRTGVRRKPWARGGEAHVYNPVGFDAAAARLVRLGIDSADFDRQVTCSNPHVEALVLDNEHGTLVTLVNWTNDPRVEVTVRVRLPGGAAGRAVRSIEAGKRLAARAEDDTLTFTTTVARADFITIR